MYSFIKPPMKDARKEAAVGKARSQNGVHLYFDEPHTMRHKQYNTPVVNWLNPGSENLTWTTVCCAAQDGAEFGVRISNPNDNLVLEYGVTENVWTHYANVCDNNKWQMPHIEFIQKKLYKNDYVVFTAHMKYLKATRGLKVEFELDGVARSEFRQYKDNQDFSTLANIFGQHINNFKYVQIVETHFLYTGITQGLPARGSTNDYISFKDADLCNMRAGDTAVILGKYVAYNSKYRGILIGVGSQGAPAAFYDFASYKDSQHTATFRVQLGFFDDVSFSSDKEEQTLPFSVGVDEAVWLLVENIDILNLEIHSTLRNR